MLYVVNRMVLAHANVYLIIMAIRMKVADQNVLFILTAHRTEAVSEINASIHVPEFARKTLNAELLTICHHVLVELVILEILIDTVPLFRMNVSQSNHKTTQIIVEAHYFRRMFIALDARMRNYCNRSL